MTNPTPDTPFEFEGVRVSRSDNVVRCSNVSGVGREEVTYKAARILHAFIEAECNADWQWTNDEHTEARKGRFTVSWSERFETWDVRHDDFPSAITPSNNKAQNGWAWICEDVLKSFLTWQAAQAPTFTPPDVPEVGQYGRFELGGGTVVEGEVTEVERFSDVPWPNWKIAVDGLVLSIYTTSDGFREASKHTMHRGQTIIAWSPIDRPQPEEPTLFGAVVEVEWRTGKVEIFTNADKWRSNDDGEPIQWWEFQKAKRVTIKSPGVEL